MPHIDKVLEVGEVIVVADVDRLDNHRRTVRPWQNNAALERYRPVGSRQKIELWQRRRTFLFRPHIAPDETAPFLGRIPWLSDFCLEPTICRLKRHGHAMTKPIEGPTMV